MRPANNAPVAVLQATWVLGDTRPESVPGICTDLLLAGYDSPSLRVLAGLTNAELERVRELLPQLFNELGLEQPTAVAAAWRVAQETARELLADRLAPYDAARSIGDLGTRFDPLFPLVKHFIGLWSEWDDDPQHRKEYESDIRAAAQELVVTRRHPSLAQDPTSTAWSWLQERRRSGALRPTYRAPWRALSTVFLRAASFPKAGAAQRGIGT